MRTVAHLRGLLRHGDRRTVGHVAEVVAAVLEKPALVAALVECVFDADDATRMRAADALEKVSCTDAGALQPYTSALLGLFEECEQQEVQWHLAVVLPRLHLDAPQRQRTVAVLQRCLASRSSIVKTFALQGLFDLAVQDASLLPQTADLLRTAERSGTAAMKARSRLLLAELEKRGAAY